MSNTRKKFLDLTLRFSAATEDDFSTISEMTIPELVDVWPFDVVVINVVEENDEAE